MLNRQAIEDCSKDFKCLHDVSFKVVPQILACPDVGERPNQPTDITFPKISVGKKDASLRFQKWKWLPE